MPAAFRPGIAASQAHHLAATLLATGPLIGLAWAAAARASHIGVRDAPPWQWAGTPLAAPIAFCLIAAVILITIWTALITLAATGRLTRWLPHRPRLAPTAAAIAGFGAATADVILLALLASQLAAAPAKLAAAPIALATTTRLILARRAGQHCPKPGWGTQSGPPATPARVRRGRGRVRRSCPGTAGHRRRHDLRGRPAHG